MCIDCVQILCLFIKNLNIADLGSSRDPGDNLHRYQRVCIISVSFPITDCNTNAHNVSEERFTLAYGFRTYSSWSLYSKAETLWRKLAVGKSYSVLGDQKAELGNSTREEGARNQI